MLEYMTLVNCQRIRHRHIRSGPVTCLTGNSDSGKSTCWRALRIICLNPKIPSRPKGILPKGPKFARHGTSFFRITIGLDGHTITRIKGKRNVYILDGKVFKNPDKTGIPKPIQQILKISGLNFQSQHSPPLWFHDSPSQVGKELNRVINLEMIDQVMTNSASLARKAKASRTETKQRLSEAKQELGELSHVPELVAQVQALVELDADIEKAAERIKRGANLVREVSRTKSNVQRLDTIVSRRNHCDSLGKVASQIRATSRRVGTLTGLIEAIEDKEEQVRCLTKQRNASRTGLRRIMSKVKSCPLCGRPIQS